MNKFSIPKHRYYELKHFCMQYNDWCKELRDISCIGSPNASGVSVLEAPKDATAETAARIKLLKDKIHILEQAVVRTDQEFAGYIFKGVTQGLSYEEMNARAQIPFCKEKYYYLYRKFFKVLSDLKQ